MAIGANASANSARVYLAAGVLTADVYDAAGTIKTVTVTPSLTASTEYVFALTDTGGSLGLYINGAAQTTSASGAGLGIIAAQPTTLYPGTRSATGSEFNGTIKGVKICRGANPFACVP
jgi:hypothetical protein